jgi:diguanylate cyclase (GGDEF)-like protein
LIRNEKFPRFIILAGMTFSLLVVWVLFAVDLRSDRIQRKQINSKEIILRTRVLAERNESVIGRSEMILNAVIRWMKHHPEADPLHNREFLDLAGTYQRYNDFHLDIRLVDRAGKLHYLNGSPGKALADVSDREYFRVQKDRLTAGFHIAQTLKSRITGSWGIPISVPAEPNTGNIAVVFVSYELGPWLDLFRNSPSRDDQVFLVRSDGIILMNYPFNEKYIGKPVASVLKEWDIPRVFSGEGNLSPLKESGQSVAAFSANPRYSFAVLSVNTSEQSFRRKYKIRAGFLVLESSLIVINAGILLLLFRHILFSRLKMQELALTDGLTGLPNRRAFESQSRARLSRAERHTEDVCLLMIDIDHFKSVNDTFGHQAGDKVLVELARSMEETFRASDLLGRIGGEEFTVLLPETSIGQAGEIAERFRIIVGRTIFLPDGKPVSVSIGVADRKTSELLSSLSDRADKALYAAKRNGRNRVMISGRPPQA